MLAVTGALALGVASSGVTWWAATRHALAPPALAIANDVTRVTADAGLTTDPAVSPTGSLLAYASDRGGANLNIWVQPLPAGQPVQVTRGDADARQPSFSPDGSRIVFRSERDGGGIYVAPALGGAERLVAGKGSLPVFSPDGRRLLYQAGGRGSGIELWVVDEAGGVPVRLAPELRNPMRPRWSPDGSAIAVVARLQGPAVTAGEFDQGDEWYRVDVGTGVVSSMHAAAVFKAAGLPVRALGAWRADEIIVSAPAGDSESLWSVGLSADGRTVTGPPRRLTAGSGLDRSPTITSGAAGRELYFASLDERANLYRLPLDVNAGRVSGELQSLTDAAARDTWPSVSSDGKFLVFASDRRSGASAWFKNLDTLEETPLGAVDSLLVNISPDGQRVIYRTGVQGKPAFVVRAIRGGAAEPIHLDSPWLWDWPAAGWVVTGGKGADVNKLAAQDLATGKLRLLLTGETGQTYGHGRLSPDGRWMSAMEWTTAGRARIIVFPFRGTPVPPAEWVVVTDEDSVAEESAWSPDGNLLYFVSERDGSRCVWMQRLDPQTKHPIGPPTALLHLHGSRRSMIPSMGDPSRFALTGNSLIFSMQLQRGNIWHVTLKP